MKTKIIAVLAALIVPAILATVAIKLEPSREFVQLGREADVQVGTITYLSSDTNIPDRSGPTDQVVQLKEVRYELGIAPERVRRAHRHHRHHRRAHRAQNVSLAPGAGVGSQKPEGPPPCVKRGGITICDPKAHTRTKISRKPRRHRSWYLPERPTNDLEPFNK